MKRTLALLSILSIGLIIFSSSTDSAPSKGYTGSPGDNNNCTHCHNGVPQVTPNMISSNIPTEGYEPGKDYEIVFTISESGKSKFGFQMTSENASNQKQGTFKASSTTKAQNSGQHITHVSSSTSRANSQEWKVTWTAPAKGSGTITFYGAGNASNSRGNATGDVIKTSSLSVNENTTVGIGLPVAQNNEFRVFPNPVSNQLTVRNGQQQYSIFNANGQQVLGGEIIETQQQVDVSGLTDGVYILYDKSNGNKARFIKL